MKRLFAIVTLALVWLLLTACAGPVTDASPSGVSGDETGVPSVLVYRAPT